MMLTTLNPSAAANAPAQAAPAAAQDAQSAPAGQQPQDLGAVPPFAEWLGQQAQAALQAVQSALPVDGAQLDAAPAPGDTAGARPATEADDDTKAAPLQDNPVLAAMAMPLIPLSPAQVAQAVQAAQPMAAQAADAKPADADDSGAPAAAATRALSVTAAGMDAGRAGANSAAALPQRFDANAVQHAQPRQDAAPAPRAAAAQQQPLAANAADATARDGGGERAGSGNATPGASAAALAANAPAQPAAAAPVQDSVKLAGPPTAWRQSLQEALGDRLHLQVGNNIEQAVIRLEPPQLGRIDIAIRHSAGTLEVNISATHGEVLRQLQSVSDNIKSDLAQRQFSEVAVTVAPAPKNNAAPFGDPQQGRGRQRGREQEDQQPGRALAEAGNPASGFSLGGRD